MSKALTTIQERIAAQLAVQRNTVAKPGGNNISLKGKLFQMPDGDSSNGPLTAVVLDHRNVNTHYSGAYSPGNVTPPDCYAIGEEIDTLGPPSTVEKPYSKLCEGCPKNEWGSGAGRGKACQNTVRLALVPADATADTEPMTMKISPSGLNAWNKLNADLLGANMLPIQTALEITFDPNETYPKLRFRAIDLPIDVELLWSLREKAQVLLDRDFD